MGTSPDPIMQLADNVRHYRAQGIDKTLSEQDAKALLVEPLLQIAGWDVGDPAQVAREDRPTERPVDYSLKLEGKPRVLVECKRLSNRLESRKDLEQALAYGAAAGVKWCVLTNGSLVKIYNSLAPEVATKKLLDQFDLAKVATPDGLSPQRAVEILTLISPESVDSGRIDRVWDQRYTGGKVRDTVAQIWSGPDPDLVNLVRRRLRDRGHSLSKRDTRNWLKTLDVSVRAKPIGVAQAPGLTVREAEGKNDRHPVSNSSRLEKGTYGLPQLERSLRATLGRPSTLTPRLVCFLEILLSGDRVFPRVEVRHKLFEKGIGSDVGQAGRYLSNVSQLLTGISNAHLRQVIQFDGGSRPGEPKDNYRIVGEYRDLLQRLVDGWNESDM